MNNKITITPYTIQCILDQVGQGLDGGIVYCGGRNLLMTFPLDGNRAEECRPERESTVTPFGMIDTPVSLRFRVNARRDVRVVISYEPDDTYTVRLWRAHKLARRMKDGVMGEVLREQRDVYCDMLQEVVERFYDGYIREYQKGTIQV